MVMSQVWVIYIYIYFQPEITDKESTESTKKYLFNLLKVSVLLATSEVRSEKPLKLCGREYIRTVIYICASSRWRRDLEGIPLAQQAERGNYFWLPNEHEISEESTAQHLLKVDSTEEGSLQYEQLLTEELGGSKKFSGMSRRDLQTLCCNTGCSMADLSTLC